MENPIPNDLDNALSLLIPAVMACGNPRSPVYLDLKAFEQTVQAAGCWRGLLADKRGRRVLDERVARQVEVAFRHCMHEAAMAMAEIVSGGGGSSGCAPGGGGAGSGAGGVGIGGGGNGGGLGRGVGGLAKSKRPGSGGDSSEALEASMPLGLLSLALEFVSTEVAASERSIESSLTGLPMVLLEDFLESQGRETCKEFWSLWVEPNSGRLTTAGMMQGGRYTLIRLCKKLAQRMSKTHDSSFCGQMHLFLSKAFGFFERSGLNVTGGVNYDNITAFEGEEQFRKAMWGFDGEEEVGAAAGGTGTGGGSGDRMEVDSGGGKDVQQQQEEFAVDYGLYQSFWRLQEYALKPDAAVKGDKAKATWKAILHDVDKILGAFEANAFSEHDLRLARERWAAASSTSIVSRGSSTLGGVSVKRKRGFDAAAGMEGFPNKESGEAFGRQGEKKSGAGCSGGYFGLKYLTSSRLLRLQLRDPTLRLQVLTQWLILAASLKSKVGKDKDSPNSGADLNPRMERAKELVKATPPRGEEYLGMLETVLQRESAWTQWKDVGKCNAVEPVADVEARALEAPSAATARGKKQRVLPTAVDAERAKRERSTYAPLGSDFNLEKMVTRLRGVIPSAEKHLEDQRMYAEDPETDPSELPSSNPLYTWRALRLLSAEDPANLARCFDGDLVKVMARLDEARKAATSTKAEEVTASAAAMRAPTSATAPVPPADASPKQPISSSSPGASAALSPQVVASPASRMAAPLSRAPTPGPMAAKAKASAPSPFPASLNVKDATPQKGPKAHRVPAVIGKKIDGVPSAKLEARGVSAGTAIVVDGEDDEEEEKKNDAPKSGREASSANGDAGEEGNGEASTQRAAKWNALKRPESPAARGASAPSAPAVSGPKSPARTSAGRAVEVANDDSKTLTKAREGGRKSPAPAVASPSRKTTSSPPPTLMGWMAPAAGASSAGAGVTSKGEETNVSKGNTGGKGGIGNDSGKVNGDAEGVEEPAETLSAVSAPTVSPNSRMTRRKSRSLGKDAGEGGK